MSRKIKSTYDAVMVLEQGDPTQDDGVRALQKCINEGVAWKFQGCYGRAMMDAIERGVCALGKEPAHDAYGNRIPSRFEVKAGTKGSVEFVQANGNEVLE